MTPERIVDELIERVELVSRKVDKVATSDLKPLDLQHFSLSEADLTDGKLNEQGREKVRVFFDTDIRRHDRAFSRIRTRSDGALFEVWDLDIASTDMMEALAFEPTNRVTNEQLRPIILIINNLLGKVGQLAEALNAQQELFSGIMVRMIERAIGGDGPDPELDAVFRTRPPKDAH